MNNFSIYQLSYNCKNRYEFWMKIALEHFEEAFPKGRRVVKYPPRKIKGVNAKMAVE